MTATIIPTARIQVREAVRDDDAPLRAIAAACPMEGDLTLRITRDPDFFQLNRLEGSQWRLGVAEVDGRVVGCAMGAERTAYVHGVEQRTMYAGDLKVLPEMRGTGVADALIRWVMATVLDMGGPDIPILLTVLAGNRAMERRTSGRGTTPGVAHFATIRAFSIPLLFPRSFRESGLRISKATPRDIEEMMELWRRVASERQLAPVFTSSTFASSIASAPGLNISNYRLARDASGRLMGFMAWWDQAGFKQSRVLRYSPRLRVARALLNAVATLTRAVPLPGVGELLRYCTAFNICVPGEAPEVLNALVRSTYGELRHAGYAFATIGLDVHDPLCSALSGLLAQPTDINAFIYTTSGDYAGPSLSDRPLHYEIALV